MLENVTSTQHHHDDDASARRQSASRASGPAREIVLRFLDRFACPQCHSSLDAAGACPSCGPALRWVEGRACFLSPDRVVRAHDDPVVHAQARARTGRGRSGLRGLADRVRSASTASIFADDRTQIPMLVDRVSGTLGPDPLVVDLGASEQYYRPILERLGPTLALDLSLYGATDVLADAHALPFANGSVSALCAFEVLEHLERPWDFVSEAARVLRPGGALLGVAPQYCPTHGFPHDFFRFTGQGITSLARSAALEVEALWPIGGAWSTLQRWAWSNHARDHWSLRVRGLSLVAHAGFQALSSVIDRLDARDYEHGAKETAHEHRDQLGWAFVLRRPR
jgi:SAM-dependent methyltransferase